MKFIKRLGALFVALCLMATMVPAAFAADAKATGAITLTIGSPTMSVNGTSTTIDAEGSRATLYKGYTMLPLRSVVENMGGTVSWNAANQQITMKYNGSTVSMTLGSKTAYANGVAKSMSVAPFTDNGRTYVWLRSLESFPGVTVGWRADTRQATVVYPMVAGSTLATQPVQLKITNTSTVAYKEIRFAPAGTESWGGNVLPTQLYANSIANVTANFAKVKYDMQLTGAYGYKSYIRNLDFTNAGSYGSLTITSADAATLVLDGVLASGTDSNVLLTVRNNTGNVITSIVYGSAATGAWSDEQLAIRYLAAGGYTTMTLPYASAKPYYDFRITYQSGWQVTYTNVNLASSWGTQMVTFNANGQVSYANSSTSTNSGSTEITFKNNYGKTVYELRMALSNTDSAFRNAKNLIDTTKNGDTDKFSIDLTGMRKWYIRAYDKDGDVIESGSVTFSSNNPKTATITLKKSGFALGSSSSADTGLLISNMSGKEIYGMFVLDPDDDDYKNSWDYDDFNDEYDDIGELDAGEYDIFDLDLYGKNDNEMRLIIFTDEDDFVEREISFNKNISDIGVLCITKINSSDFDYDKYDDDKDDLADGELVFAVYNADEDYKLKNVYVRKASKGDADDDDNVDDFKGDLVWSSTDLSTETGKSEVFENDEWGNEGYYDFLFEFEGNRCVTVDDEDLTDYDYFIQFNVTHDDVEFDGE
ncbi:copper amine oxidase N-terminal domain-containing protein [Butyricicoccus pullicaecorum]|uniref:copper amine oxidase N-terminal domain-containing protein n=1 Tax=Butyricicoccus pullicaecorum TaxID=501571 RepID=UPI003522A1DA